MSDSMYIHFELEGKSISGKTSIWKALTKSHDVMLGRVRWYAPWRGYNFFVSSKDGEFELVFGKRCLRDIANFCEIQTYNQRKAQK